MNGLNQIIFVCANDTCRGPMAAEIMKSKFLHSPVKICSRGLVVLFPEPLNQKAEAVMIRNGIMLDKHESVQLREADFGEDHLIITMDLQAKEKIIEEFEGAQNVYVLNEVVGEEGEVPNPYGGPLTDYGKCYDILNKLITKLVKKLNKEELECLK
ncbi:arsenate reductase/protein-tyrosine-phosphatase family protein [Anaerosacchariphilus polymeriproducens]|uniref:Phosphotyrosine protein phosphatase n=1 Tax=Anaerosacchariphilus polymeriproducens TaxID=1812858 RepID=A0A371AY40_9FIRM|nr:phosphotyrosine protein phosphatase [Anaerosacchariphilus polymeriproducens]RDU24459.1 phosphotyrosine protein phosphatase [Anaerosacchariphilus polymeriproducens]